MTLAFQGERFRSLGGEAMRGAKPERGPLGVLIFIVAVGSTAFTGLYHSVGGVGLTLILLAIVGSLMAAVILVLRFRRARAEAAAAEGIQRRMALAQKYGAEKADDIIAGKIWCGMSADQLRESWGQPEEIETDTYKGRMKETWKYRQFGKNRFEDRVQLDNQKVVGWKGKGNVELDESDLDETETQKEELHFHERDGRLPKGQSQANDEAQSTFEVGDRVIGQWTDGAWYPGTIAGLKGGRYDVDFDDGDKKMLSAKKLKLLEPEDLRASQHKLPRSK